MTSLFCIRKIACVLAVLVFVSCIVAVGSDEAPLKVTICQLKDDPAAYNHKLIEVTGFISHGFEDFTLLDPSCSSWSGIWLEYGGTTASGTMYCCGVTAERSRPAQLVIENIPVPLVDDARFREFDKLLRRSSDSIAHATIVGRFFAGEKMEHPKGARWGGYGHMGCCTLLAIQQVTSVDAQDRDDLDYSESPDPPELDKEGCGYQILLSRETYYGDLIEAQRKAEQGQREWSFTDPQRVASAALARLLNTDEKSIARLRQMRTAQGRIVYRWPNPAKRASYRIVVSRPYWLSFYAKDTKRIAWVVIAAYKSSCD
jgi:hypothetical protein